MKIQNQLAYNLADCKLDITNNLVRHATIYSEQAKDIKAKLDAFPIVLLQENAGSGKSQTVGEFSKLIHDENITMGLRQRIVFATNTRANRNAFAAANGFIVILGISEIIEKVAGAEVASLVGVIYDELNEDESIDIVKRLLDDGDITPLQAKDIREKVTENKTKLRVNLFVAMTVAKIQVGEFIKTFSGYYVFLDEMSYDKLIHIDGEVTVYQTPNVKNYEVDKDGNKVNERVNVNSFFENIKEISSIHRDDIKLDNTKVVLLSAEKSLSYAFGSVYAPKTRYVQAGRPVTLVDDNLTIVYVRSTSNSHDLPKATKSNRAKIADVCRSYNYEVIADGADTSGTDVKAIGDYTFEGSKGHNDMMDKNLVTIIGMPHIFEVADVMCSLGVDENTAVSIICSDKANQALGRNTGYRARGGKHILFIPKQLSAQLDSARLITLDTISENVFEATSKASIKAIPQCDAKDIVDELFTSDDFVIQQTAAQLLHRFKMLIEMNPLEVEIRIQAKLLKEALKQTLSDIGVAKTRAAKGGLVSKVIVQLELLGVTKIRGRDADYYVVTKAALMDLGM